jgi:hypothetical protein
MIRKLPLLLGSLLLFSAISLSGALAEEATDTYLLLSVESDGVLAARDLVFTNVETGAEVWVRDLLSLGRAGSRKYMLQPVAAGEYYLSSIYPVANLNDNAPRIETEKSAGVISIQPGSINYIGDVLFKSRERGRGVRSSFDYEPNSNTLIAAVGAERELFQRLNVVISIAGNAPVPVDKKLLGL